MAEAPERGSERLDELIARARSARDGWLASYRREHGRDPDPATLRKADRRLLRSFRAQARRALMSDPRRIAEAAAGTPFLFAGFYVTGHGHWGFGFLAFGLGATGLGFLRALYRVQLDARAAAERVLPAAPPPEEDVRQSAIDSLCARILEELERTPAVTTELLRDLPMRLEQMRAAHHALLEREERLRSLADGGGRRLADEHAALERRIAAETDATVRDGLNAALSALETRRAQEQQLESAAARMEAERKRIGYSLETILAQLVRLGASVPASDSQALHDGLRRIADELEAMAAAFEELAPGDTRSP